MSYVRVSTNAKPKLFDPGLFQGYIMTDTLCAQVSGVIYGVICSLKHECQGSALSLGENAQLLWKNIPFFF